MSLGHIILFYMHSYTNKVNNPLIINKITRQKKSLVVEHAPLIVQSSLNFHDCHIKMVQLKGYQSDMCIKNVEQRRWRVEFFFKTETWMCIILFFTMEKLRLFFLLGLKFGIPSATILCNSLWHNGSHYWNANKLQACCNIALSMFKVNYIYHTLLILSFILKPNCHLKPNVPNYRVYES